MSDFKVPNMENLMKAAQKIQEDLAKKQEELSQLTCEAAAGGGMVKVTVNGHYEIVELTIEKDVVDPEDVAMLQDLITAAVNQGLAKVRELAKEKMAELTGGLGVNIPGLNL